MTVKKKMLSLVLTSALVLSASSVSQAASTEVSKTDGRYAAGEVKVVSEFAVPTIKVELSNTTNKKIAINPYGLTLTVAGIPVGDDLQKEQLVNKVETITNDSEVALAVNATVSAVIKGKAKLATAPIQSSEKTNSIFAYLQIDVGDDIISATEYDAKSTNQAVFAAKESSKKAMVTLKDKNQATGKKASYKIRGNVAQNPTQMWVDEDGADFRIVFDFEPKVLPD